MSTSKTLYLSFDIEANGPCPSVNSLVSIGIYGFDNNKLKIVEYQRNIIPHPSRVIDEKNKKEFWDVNPGAFAFVQTNQVSAETCMAEIATLYQKMIDLGYDPKKGIKWVARPGGYDWQWLNCYYNEFGPKNKPYIGFKPFCLSTAIDFYTKFMKLNAEEENQLWKDMKGNEKITHNPLDDARCQARMMQVLYQKSGIDL